MLMLCWAAMLPEEVEGGEDSESGSSTRLFISLRDEVGEMGEDVAEPVLLAVAVLGRRGGGCCHSMGPAKSPA